MLTGILYAWQNAERSVASPCGMLELEEAVLECCILSPWCGATLLYCSKPCLQMVPGSVMLFHDNIHGTDCKDSICTCCSVADRSSLWHEEEVSVLTDRLYSAPYSAYWTFCLAKHSMMHDLPDGVGSSQPQMPGSYLQFPACMRLQIYRGLHNNAEQNGRNPWHVLFCRPGLAAVPVISKCFNL